MRRASRPHSLRSGLTSRVTLRRPPTPADIVRANDIRARVRQALGKCEDYRVAERDGFEIRFPNVQQKPLQFYRQFGPSGSIATQEECTSTGGRFIPIKYGWMTHVDFYDSPKP